MITLTQLRELARLIDQMIWDAIDNQLARIEKRCKDYLKTPKPKGEK